MAALPRPPTPPRAHRSWWRALTPATLLARLLPQACYLCAAPAGRHVLCPACAAALPALSAARCPCCALPSPGGQRCGACLSHPPAFDATWAALAYSGGVEHLVHGLKYRHRLALAPALGQMLLATLPAPPALDCLIPLPLHASRLRGRGFNQAMEIARPLARAWRLPLWPLAAVRERDTTPQATLPWKARQANIRGAFRVERPLTGLRVGVVDDVMTTGATLHAFAQALKDRGATHVTNLVVARTLPGHGRESG